MDWSRCVCDLICNIHDNTCSDRSFLGRRRDLDCCILSSDTARTGAPLFLLLARIAAMIPFLHDPAARMHLLSAASSSLTCTILYDIIIKLLRQQQGDTCLTD